MKTLFSLLLGLSVLQAQVKEVKIGTQVWMTKNLDVAKFRNGDPIPEAKTNEEWAKAGENKQPAWCYYDNDPANGTKYGKLYNWYAVIDPRGLAPKGYHIPTDDEWDLLSEYLGGVGEEFYIKMAPKMKFKTGWHKEYNGGTPSFSGLEPTNSSGFSGLPGGVRGGDGTFGSIGYTGFWWCITESQDKIYNGFSPSIFVLTYDDGPVEYDPEKEDGSSVRCLRDNVKELMTKNQKINLPYREKKVNFFQIDSLKKSSENTNNSECKILEQRIKNIDEKLKKNKNIQELLDEKNKLKKEQKKINCK